MHACSDLNLVTKADAADIFGVCVKTIDNHSKLGILPRPIQFASKEYWHPDDFREFPALTFRRSNVEPQKNVNGVSGSTRSYGGPSAGSSPSALRAGSLLAPCRLSTQGR